MDLLLNPSSPSKPIPALRQSLDAVQIEHEGQPMLLLRDQEGLVDTPMALTMGGFLVATAFDGTKTSLEIQTLINQKSGQLIPLTEIEKLASQLETAELLETEKVSEKRKKVWQDFISSPVRKAHLMGAGYPKEPLDLAVFMGKFFTDSKGPGSQLPTTPEKRTSLKALVVPHIDLYRGGPAYAWGYRELANTTKPDLILSFGVAHVSPNSPWVMTPKSFETPYGPLSVDQSLYNEVKAALWYDERAEEWTHRLEHSLEFQALWLKYIWRDSCPAWVPILTSSFEPYCTDSPPSTVETIQTAIKKIGKSLRDRIASGQKILLLAGVDLAHVGPRFGDDIQLTPDVREKLKQEDMASINLALSGAIDDYYLSVVKDGHPRKWCGLSALYTVTALLKEVYPNSNPGKLLAYDQADDPSGGVVSFMSATFE